MADILRITQLVNPKNYTAPTRPLTQSDAVFDIVDLSKIVKTNDRSEEFRQDDSTFTGNNADAMLDIQLKISKNPSFTSSLLKNVVGEDFLTKLSESASSDIVNEFNEFAKNIFLSGDKLASDLISQGKGTTAFNGELFDALREMLSQNQSAEFKTALSTFLKNTFSLLSQKEILNSLSDNFQYLASALYPSKSLSGQLSELSNAFLSSKAALNFSELKNQAFTLLDSAGESLITTDKIKDMIALIKYNLSRFNDNPLSLQNAFRSLSELSGSSALKDSLFSLFEKFIQSSKLPQTVKDTLLSESDKFYQTDRLVYQLAEKANEQSKSINADSLKKGLDAVAEQLSSLTDSNGDKASLSVKNGSELIKNLLSQILPQGSESDVSQLMKAFEQTSDLNTLINRLSFLLGGIENSDVRNAAAHAMNAVLTKLSVSPDIIYKAPSSMEQIADFLLKALGNENIRYLGIVDPNTVVQSMLTAPGVFTPLLHCILPVAVDDLRSYGDLWIEGENENDDTSENDESHLFLSFEIEKMGMFELEMFSVSNNLEIALYCPPDYAGMLNGLKRSFSEIAAKSGYNVKASRIAPLKKQRTLTDVFPKISERRSGLNVKI